MTIQTRPIGARSSDERPVPTRTIQPSVRSSAIREGVAVLAAGGIGTFAVFAAVTISLGVPLSALMAHPGKFVVAVLTAATFPMLHNRLGRAPARALALIVATLVPSVLANTVFVGATPTPWLMLLGFNAIFAVVALTVYEVIARTGRN